MADFRKHFEYTDLPNVTGEIWTTRSLAILIVSEANTSDVELVENYDLQGRQWGEHPVTDELHTAIRHLMQTANDRIDALDDYVTQHRMNRVQREFVKIFKPAKIDKAFPLGMTD